MKARSRLCSAFRLRHQEAQAGIQSLNPSTIVQGSVEQTFAWATRFRGLVRDYERLPQTLADLHVIALVCLMLRQAVNYIAVHNSH